MKKILASLVLICFLVLGYFILTAQTITNTLHKPLKKLGQWSKCYGGNSIEKVMQICPTLDGGYIFSGLTCSNDGDVKGYAGTNKTHVIWIVKLNNTGGIQWEKCFGNRGSMLQVALVCPTQDGGYICAGNIGEEISKFGDYISHGKELWVTKLDSLGKTLWQRYFKGGPSGLRPHKILEIHNGNVIIAGGMIDTPKKDTTFLLKINKNGIEQWRNELNREKGGECFDFQPASDGGYVGVGGINLTPANKSSYQQMHFWVFKITESGELQWEKSYGGSRYDIASGIQKAHDGGYFVWGETQSSDGDVKSNIDQERKLWLIKIDKMGNLEGETSFKHEGGAKTTICTAKNGGYFVTQNVYDFGEKIYKIKVSKYDEKQSVEWQESFGQSCVKEIISIRETMDGGLIGAGEANSLTGGERNFDGYHNKVPLELISYHDSNRPRKDIWVFKLPIHKK